MRKLDRRYWAKEILVVSTCTFFFLCFYWAFRLVMTFGR